MNLYYIPIRLVSQDFDYKRLYDLYHVQQVPTVIIIKPDGSEVDRVVDLSGYGKQYTQFLIDTYEGKNTYADLKAASENAPQNLKLAYKLFLKELVRGEIAAFVKTGKRILQIEKNSSPDQLSAEHREIFEKTRYHIRTSLFRYGKEAVLNYFSEFPTVTFSKNIYRFLAFTYSKSAPSEKADQFYKKALQDFPDEYAFKKYFLRYCVKNKIQIEKATRLAETMTKQKDFNDVVVEQLYSELKELKDMRNN